MSLQDQLQCRRLTGGERRQITHSPFKSRVSGCGTTLPRGLSARRPRLSPSRILIGDLFSDAPGRSAWIGWRGLPLRVAIETSPGRNLAGACSGGAMVPADERLQGLQGDARSAPGGERKERGLAKVSAGWATSRGRSRARRGAQAK